MKELLGSRPEEFRNVSKGVQISLGALAIVALAVWFGWTSLGGEGSFQYFQTLDEFRTASVAGPARVHGYVAEGTILRDLASQTVSFEVQQDPPHAGGAAGTTLPVRFASLETPDLFKAGAEVVVEGELAANGDLAVFHATKVFAKCPSKFQAEGTEQASF
jgi:cytochrome c-type biogenesis protein CcmE